MIGIRKRHGGRAWKSGGWRKTRSRAYPTGIRRFKKYHKKIKTYHHGFKRKRR